LSLLTLFKQKKVGLYEHQIDCGATSNVLLFNLTVVNTRKMGVILAPLNTGPDMMYHNIWASFELHF
jgi:hypothetical protein